MTYSVYPNISSIIDRYDGLLVDLWGVVHDGQSLYPGVLDCLTKIKQKNKSIIFLSNAPRRASRAKKVLDNLGIPATLYHSIVTSGEVTFEYVKSNNFSLGKRFIILGPDKDDNLLDDLPDYIKVNDYKDADFVIVTGFDHDDSVLEDVIPQLQLCFQYRLPMICANPDIEVVRQTGERALCAGVISNHYVAMGGKVLFFGKPYPDVYHRCFEQLKSNNCYHIAAIGDNLETDIAGAKHLEIDSYLVTGGILRENLKIMPGELPSREKLDTLFKNYAMIPTGVIPAFIW